MRLALISILNFFITINALKRRIDKKFKMKSKRKKYSQLKIMGYGVCTLMVPIARMVQG